MSSRSAQLAVRALSTTSSVPQITPVLRCAKCSTRHSSNPSPSKRHITTTPSTSGVKTWLASRQRLPPTPGSSHADFIQAIRTTSFTPLRDAYDSLIAQRNSASEPHKPTLTEGELMQAMTFLSQRQEVVASRLLKRIYEDLEGWGVKVDLKHFRAVLRGLCSSGQISEAIDWTEKGKGTIDDWRTVIKGAIRHDRRLVPLVEEKLRAQTTAEGKKLSSPDFILLLRHLRFIHIDEQETIRRLRVLLAEAKANGEWIQKWGEVELVGIHLRIGDLARAGNIVEGWYINKEAELWNTMLDWRIARNEGKGVEDALVKMKELGLEPYGKAIGHLVRRHIQQNPSCDINNFVNDIERKYSAKMSSATWAEILDLQPDLEARLALYEQVRSSGVPIETHIAKSLIIPLCNLEPPNLRFALDVYADLTSRSLVFSTSTVRDRILYIYTNLFRAYSRLCPGADEKIPLNLLKDMRRFGLALPTPALTSLIISLIRCSPDHYAAFNNYAHVYALNPSMLDAKAYTAVITAFIGHSTPKSPIAPPSYIIEMLKDMRKAGYKPSPQILTSLLSNYGQQAVRSRKSSTDPVYRQTKLDGIYKAISEIHNMLKLESLVTADVPLYNALMNAYSRIGAYSAAFEVWDILVEWRHHIRPKSDAKEVFGPSISIILDACGRSGQAARAQRIWAWARRHHLVEMEGRGKGWEGWVECLCRLGQVEEASKVVMKEANLEMVRILGKFSWQEKNLHQTLPARLEEKYPEYWEVVSKEIEGRKKWGGRSGTDEDIEEGDEEGVPL